MKLTAEQKKRLAKLDLDLAKMAAEWKAEDAAGIVQEPDDLPESDVAPKGKITAILIPKLNVPISKKPAPKKK